eukprot:scaffold97537_cov19-Tisochrysis_lutea.AAC.1
MGKGASLGWEYGEGSQLGWEAFEDGCLLLCPQSSAIAQVILQRRRAKRGCCPRCHLLPGHSQPRGQHVHAHLLHPTTHHPLHVHAGEPREADAPGVIFSQDSYDPEEIGGPNIGAAQPHKASAPKLSSGQSRLHRSSLLGNEDPPGKGSGEGQGPGAGEKATFKVKKNTDLGLLVHGRLSRSYADEAVCSQWCRRGMPAPMQCFLAADVCSGIPALVHACIHAAIPCSRCGGVQASQSLLKAVQ